MKAGGKKWKKQHVVSRPPVRYVLHGSIGESYMASPAPRTWNIITFILRSAARSKYSMRSACCLLTESEPLSGQSMFHTVVKKKDLSSSSGESAGVEFNISWVFQGD